MSPIRRTQEFPKVEFKTIEEANKWAKKLTEALHEDTTLRSYDIDSAITTTSHNHAASDINSGTLVHERGGLEADVSGYAGLVKITGGATSAITDSSTNWDTAYTHSGLTTGNPHSVTKANVALGSVENTALSTWAGTTNITTLGTITQASWIAPSLLNSWVDYASGYNPTGYFKDSLGIVHLRGFLKDGTIGQAMFVLPVGYRPAYMEAPATISSGFTVGNLTIATDGNVIPYGGNNTWYSLDGITFRIA